MQECTVASAYFTFGITEENSTRVEWLNGSGLDMSVMAVCLQPPDFTFLPFGFSVVGVFWLFFFFNKHAHTWPSPCLLQQSCESWSKTCCVLYTLLCCNTVICAFMLVMLWQFRLFQLGAGLISQVCFVWSSQMHTRLVIMDRWS